MTATSISDFDRYKILCAKAAEDPLFFEIIRRHPTYMSIVETLDPQSGAEYAAIALQNEPKILDVLEELRRSDLYGGPLVTTYDPLGPFSPTTLRYIKIATDLRRLFGALDGMRVAEIGGGYGGQSRILHALHAIAGYTIFDLPEPLALTRRYLACFGIDHVRLAELTDESSDNYDLVISNYAFSEIRKDVQQVYLEKIVLRARHGYMIYNEAFFAQRAPGYSYTSEEICAVIPHATIVAGSPGMPQADARHGNVLVYW